MNPSLSIFTPDLNLSWVSLDSGQPLCNDLNELVDETQQLYFSEVKRDSFLSVGRKKERGRKDEHVGGVC